MGRPALAATRAIEILTLLEARPTQSFTMSEICAQLNLSPSSCHALMKVLSQAGYVARHPVHKSYGLGPALIAVGHAALECHRAIDLARDEVRHLADKLHMEAIASAPINQDLVVLARAGRPRYFELLPRIGQRLPHIAPVGAVFVAWDSSSQTERWSADSDCSPDNRTELETLLSQIRRRGYEVALATPTRDDISQMLTNLALSPHSSDARSSLTTLIRKLLNETYFLKEICDDHTYNINYCMAPVFGPNGQVVLGLTLLGFPSEITGAALSSYVAELVNSARLITLSADGHLPGGSW